MSYKSIIVLFQMYLLLTNCVQCQEISQKVSSIAARAEQAKEFAKANGLDTTVCILIDMNIHSGKYRLFTYDLEDQKILNSGLCSHGDCKGESMDTASFSNVPNTHCSSIGHYKVGKRSYSNWGVNFHYKLHGLESTNDNAFKRIIVLHSFDWVEDEEVYPDYCITSWGCPMVSNKMMKYLDTQIKSAKQPLLLWIYKSE